MGHTMLIFSHIQQYHMWHTTSSHLIETQNLSLSQWMWRVLSYRPWNCAVCYISSAVSEKPAAIIVRQSRNCVQWMNNQRIPGPSWFLNQNVCDFHFWKNLMITVYRHNSCIIGNSQCQSRKWEGTFSVHHKLQYVTGKGDRLMESITFSRYCNIRTNVVGRTPFSLFGSLCELQHSLSVWWLPKWNAWAVIFIELKIRLWQFRSLKHSSENSYWQLSTQAGQSNMDTKLCNFFSVKV
jgi:hypothetical protein